MTDPRLLHRSLISGTNSVKCQRFSLRYFGIYITVFSSVQRYLSGD